MLWASKIAFVCMALAKDSLRLQAAVCGPLLNLYIEATV